jgi:2,4-dienoyl-CoA reductase-like NADH-dependent reductase (Old Yellow Enzyme family)/thioredoxin reductase
MGEAFGNLFSPIQIGSMTVENRVALAPMANYMSDARGTMTQPQIDFMEARARGGTSLLIMGSIYVQHPHARFGVGQLGLYEDSLIPGYRRMVEAVHVHGSKVAAQIHHAGRATKRQSIEGNQPVAPSPIPAGGKYPDRPRELSVAEIQEMIDRYVETARRCEEAGFDAIELHYAHGYLPCQFMSSHSNKRSDAYGGDLHGRMRFPLELLEAVRAEIGEEVPVWCRIVGSELTEGGLTLEDTTVIARMLAEGGAAAISVSRGVAPYYWTVSNYYHELGHSVPYAEAIRAEVDVPVMVAGRIVKPAQAEAILESGKADMINLGRALIADPNWPNKAASGRTDEIRPCISCNKGCHDPKKSVRHTICLVNPEAGREGELTLTPVEEPKDLLIVGGGPAGLEAARVAALRGHRVTLYEEADQVGGRWNLACQVPEKEGFYDVIEYLRGRALAHGATIETGREVTVDDVTAIDPDAVIVATGASPVVPPIPGTDGDHVVTSDEVLAGEVEVGARALIVGGGACGLETADFLAVRGREVVVVEMLDAVCEDMLPDAKYFLMERLEKAEVPILVSTEVERIEGERVILRRPDPETGTTWTTAIEDVDTVILAAGARPNQALAEDLEDAGYDVHAVGDCVEPGFAIDAIYQGSEVARRI